MTSERTRGARSGDDRWRPSRRSFLVGTAATALLVHVTGSWPAAERALASAPARVPAVALRRAAIAGPPFGRAHGNVIRRTDLVGGVVVTTWYAGGGRAMSISEETAWYVDPSRGASFAIVELTPLTALERDIRRHFGDAEWQAMLHTVSTTAVIGV